MEPSLSQLLALGGVVGGALLSAFLSALLGARLYGALCGVAARLLCLARSGATIGERARRFPEEDPEEDPEVVAEAVYHELLLYADMTRAMGQEETEIVEGVRNGMRTLGYEERYAGDGTPVWAWSASGIPPQDEAGSKALGGP